MSLEDGHADSMIHQLRDTTAQTPYYELGNAILEKFPCMCLQSCLTIAESTQQSSRIIQNPKARNPEEIPMWKLEF